MPKNLVSYLLIVIILGISVYVLSLSVIITPNFTGKSIEEVNKEVYDKNIQIEYSFSITNDKSTIGKVISQKPSIPSIMSKYSTINLVIGVSNTPFQIVEPTNGNSVEQSVKVSGTTGSLEKGENIYILVQPLKRSGNGTYEWYIQYPVTVDNGKWEGYAQIGMSEDKGRKFNIVVITSKEKLKYGTKYGYKFPQFNQTTAKIQVIRV